MDNKNSIGKRLGCGGCLLHLRRIKTGPFHVNKAISLEELKWAIKEKRWQNYLISINEALSHIPAIVIDEFQEEKIRLGQSILWPKRLSNPLFRGLNKDNKLIALLKPYSFKEGMRLHPVKVF